MCNTPKHLKHQLGIMLGIALIVVLPTTANAVVENITPFEWAMPDRLLVNTDIPGYDSGDPIPKYDPNALMLPPDGWTVNFNACGVSTSTIVNYEWFIDGVSVANTADCEFSHQFPKEASYHITLTVTDGVGDTAMQEQTITVQDWLIVAMGDSYGSGEGNPVQPFYSLLLQDVNVLFNLTLNIFNDLVVAWEKLPTLQDAQVAAQQLVTNTKNTLNQAAADLAVVQLDLAELNIIIVNVENDPAVIYYKNNLYAAQQWVNEAQATYDADLADYNNCSFGNCAIRLAILTASEAELLSAQANLAAAEAALWTARTAATILYSAIATIQDFDALSLAIHTAQLAVNAAQNTYNTALNAYHNAQAALQGAIDAVASLQSIIDDTEAAWNDARIPTIEKYIGNLPVWTRTAPSWGTLEPTYREIMFGGLPAGDALRCHRSMYSGQARAALALELADPHTSVTFLHLSCTGATIERGIVGPYNGGEIDAVLGIKLREVLGLSDNPLHYQCFNNANEPQPCDMPSQLQQAANKTLGREVDAMVISIGGNDIHFADIITDCILGQPCNEDLGLPPTQDFSDALKAAIEENCNPVTYYNQLTGLSLPSDWFPFSDKCLKVYDLAETHIGDGDAARVFNLYTYGGTETDRNGDPVLDRNGNPKVKPSLNAQMNNLSAAITDEFSSFDQHRVYITQYPDPTGDELGNTCEWFESRDNVRQSLPGVTLGEAEWARTIVAPALRDETATAAMEHGWNFVTETGEGSDTIGTATSNHGYCASDGQHWTVRIPESLINQQDHLGTMHPNRAGHAVYKKAIFNYLVADLYPAGIDQPPRQPVDPPVSNSPGSNGGGGGGGSLNWITLLLLITINLMRRRVRS